MISLALGSGTTLVLARHSTKADDIRNCLDAVDSLASLADGSVRSIWDGNPDRALGYRVSTKREDLGIALNRVFSDSPQMVHINSALGSFGASLRHADASFSTNVPADAVDKIREAQQRLRAVIHSAADGEIAWHLFRWRRPSGISKD
ncbi:MAG: hypothetical protein JSR86_16095 [Proteobacteria bacterium]|nr:hypothetical protein [Pseudomonadota bacterium]